MQICGVFVAVVVAKNSLCFLQIWKPQFLSVVQFPFDNCHSPFSPTTFFEIGVYGHLKLNNELSTDRDTLSVKASVLW